MNFFQYITPLRYVVELLFPPLCTVCQRILAEGEQHLCLTCLTQMPLHYDSYLKEYALYSRFQGTPLPQGIYSLFIYRRGSAYDRIIYEIKYNGKTKLAYYLGKMLAEYIGHLNAWDVVIPVPLHKKRFRKRGYNQAEIIAKGVADTLKIELRTDILIRLDSRQSQTKVTIGERLTGTGMNYKANTKEIIPYRHIILIDDVITSGSTMISCCKALCAEQPIKITLASLGRTEIT